MSGEQPSVTKSLALSLEMRVDQTCDRFEAAWRAGQGARIEDCLAPAPEPERPELLRQLLALEIDLRRERGERPTPEEYAPRFPGHDGLIRAAFQQTLSESVEMSPGDLGGTGTGAPLARTGPSHTGSSTGREPEGGPKCPAAFPSLARYEVLAEAGRG